MTRKCRIFLGCIYSFAAIVMIGSSTLLFFFYRNLMTKDDMTILSQKLAQYSMTLDKSLKLVKAAGETMPYYEKSCGDMARLCDSMIPLSKELYSMSQSTLSIPMTGIVWKPFVKLNGPAENFMNALPALANAFRTTENTIAKYNSETHANLLESIVLISGNLNDTSRVLTGSVKAGEWLPLAVLSVVYAAALGFAAMAFENFSTGAAKADAHNKQEPEK